jgi:hypothetical protein
MTRIYVVILITIMMLSLLLMLANILKEKEIRSLFMLPCYFKCKLLIIICIGYHKVAATYSCIKCQCIGRELDLKVNGLCFVVCSCLLIIFRLIKPLYTL